VIDHKTLMYGHKNITGWSVWAQCFDKVRGDVLLQAYAVIATNIYPYLVVVIS